MVFALAGVPLGLIMFQSIGERVNTFIAYCLHKVQHDIHNELCFKLRDFLQANGIQFLEEITPRHLIAVSLSTGTSIIVLG